MERMKRGGVNSSPLLLFIFLSISSSVYVCWNNNNNVLVGAERLVDRPVVGIFSYPHRHRGKLDETYIAASYVKWLESAGARSIPIPWDASNELVDEIMSQVNGILYPGGGDVSLSSAFHRVWEKTRQLNLQGQYFPIWGTCLGFEIMLMLSSNRGSNILQSGFDAGWSRSNQAIYVLVMG